MAGTNLSELTRGDEGKVTTDVVLAETPPDFDARSTGMHRGIASARCNIQSSRKDAEQKAQTILMQRAEANGADYVWIDGAGDIADRGFCVNGFYRIVGEGFAKLESNSSENSASLTDSLAGRLEELEALRDRGLINQNEYEQLRERVLDEAY